MQEENLLQKRIEHIEKLIESTSSNLEKIKDLVILLKKEQNKDKYKDIKGIEGTYDGEFLITNDGKKHEVPSNYAAKSRLVFGDKLKLVEENGNHIFKQIEKVTRRKIEGILSKKEGKWFILSDTGSYRVSSNAIEFNNVELGDEAIAFIPEGNLNAPFAALDKVLKKREFTPKPQTPVEPAAPAATAEVVATVPEELPPVVEAPKPIKKPATTSTSAVKKPTAKPSASTKPKAKSTTATSSAKPAFVRPAPAAPFVRRPSKPKEQISDLTDVQPKAPAAPVAPVILDEDDLR